METKVNFVPYTKIDRQWDARFNVQEDDYLQEIITAIKAEQEAGKFKYILIGGVEIGTRPYQNDYQVKHVHVAAIFHNQASKASILKNWAIKEGNGYYLVPRNRDLPYSGWRDHHIKQFSKVVGHTDIIFEAGVLPLDNGKRKRIPDRSEPEKKMKTDEILIEMRTMLNDGKSEEAFTKFPRMYMIYGEKLKTMIDQKRDFFVEKGDPHIWLYGNPGTGKTSILQYIYPKNYKKNLDNKYFDLFKQDHHSHIILEDMDPDAVEKVGIQFMKTLCDKQGFPIDQKYKSCQLAKATVLVSSNFTIGECLPRDTVGYETTLHALMRRFWIVKIDRLLHLLSLKLLPAYERRILERQGNQDVSKLFYVWDYLTDSPTGLPLMKPEEYQEMIRDAYFK